MSQISFFITGNVHGRELNLDNLDLRLFSEFSKQVIEFIKGDQNLDISKFQVRIQSGSVAIAVAEKKDKFPDNLLSDLSHLEENTELSSIDPKRANIVEFWQNRNTDKTNLSYKIKHRQTNKKRREIIISNDTNYKRVDVWVDVEMYLIGQIYDLGGKNKPNVHMELDSGESVKIDIDKDSLKKDKLNRLYKDQLVRVRAKQNAKDSSLLKDFKFISFEEFSQSYDDQKFNKLTKEGSKAWSSVIDGGQWVEKIRGNSD